MHSHDAKVRARRILDEPTNHLDLEACVWLEEVLSKFKRILLMVSHSQDFMNGVCTNIIHMHQRRLDYYTGIRSPLEMALLQKILDSTAW